MPIFEAKKMVHKTKNKEYLVTFKEQWIVSSPDINSKKKAIDEIKKTTAFGDLDEKNLKVKEL
jgi:hypothetical protein